MSESGLLRAGGVVVLSGPALRAALQAALIATRNRRLSGLPTDTFEALACELSAAMSAARQSDVRKSAISDTSPMPPTVPLDQAATQLGVSTRQAARLAPRLGGRKIAGRWFIDEMALQEHLERTT
ncbi:hypothetical protein ACX9NE_10415 [Mycobacterium sp. ML4]